MNIEVKKLQITKLKNPKK